MEIKGGFKERYLRYVVKAILKAVSENHHDRCIQCVSTRDTGSKEFFISTQLWGHPSLLSILWLLASARIRTRTMAMACSG